MSKGLKIFLIVLAIVVPLGGVGAWLYWRHRNKAAAINKNAAAAAAAAAKQRAGVTIPQVAVTGGGGRIQGDDGRKPANRGAGGSLSDTVGNILGIVAGVAGTALGLPPQVGTGLVAASGEIIKGASGQSDPLSGLLNSAGVKV